jgi:hypothetical protein
VRRKTLATAIAATAVALMAGSLGLSGAAHADPTSQQTYSGVGSDTTQDVMAALAGQTVVCSPTQTAPAGTLTGVGSYEALLQRTNCTNSANITLNGTNGSVTFTRPNGSGSGVEALSASLDPSGGDWTVTNSDGSTSPVDIAGTLQFSRSSSGPSSPETDGPLTWVPFARDAVGYIYAGSSSDSTLASDIGHLTAAQLTSLYESDSPVTFGNTTVTAYLPQAGSGTRAFWLSTLGVTTVGTAVNQASTNEENTASVIGSLSYGTDDAAIYPFSISSYIAQFNGYTSNTGLGTVKLGNPDSTDPVVLNGTQYAPNSNFYTTTIDGTNWYRDVYNVFPTSAINDFESGTSDSYTDLLNQFVVSTDNPTPTINSGSSQAIIEDFGFLTDTYAGEVNVSTAPTGNYVFVSS